MLVDRGGASNGSAPNGATAAKPTAAATRRHFQRRVLVALHGLAALLLVAVVLPRTLRGTVQHAAPAARGADRPAGRECPHFGGSVLDMPDTADCRRLMALVAPCMPHRGQAVVGAAPSAACCQPAAAFFDSLCHCWSSQFGAEALAGIRAVEDACQARQAAAGLLPAAGLLASGASLHCQAAWPEGAAFAKPDFGCSRKLTAVLPPMPAGCQRPKQRQQQQQRRRQQQRRS